MDPDAKGSGHFGWPRRRFPRAGTPEIALNNLADEIRSQIESAQSVYNRLVLVVGPAGSGKTAALQALCGGTGLFCVNLNLVLCQALLEYPSKARPLRVRGALDDILAKAERKAERNVVVLDNIEILFDPALKQDPLRLLQLASRNRTIVASWNGDVTGRTLTYAAAGHPEHRRYTDVDTIIIPAGRESGARVVKGDA